MWVHTVFRKCRSWETTMTVPLEVQQEVLQPVHRVDVQVVGGLVHHQQVGIAEQRLGQQDLHLQPGVQGGHVVIVELGADAKALEDAAGVALGLPAAQLGVLLLSSQARMPSSSVISSLA